MILSFSLFFTVFFFLLAAKLKRPPTPYSLFMRDMADKFRQGQASNSTYNDTKGTFMEHVAVLWRELPGAEKQRYVEIAEKGQKEYMKARRNMMQGAQEI
jgi:HMG (high mobility group) box